MPEWTKINEALDEAARNRRVTSPWSHPRPLESLYQYELAVSLLLTEVRRLDEQNPAQEQALQAHREALQSVITTLSYVVGTLLLQDDALESLGGALAAIQAAIVADPLPTAL